MGLLATNTVLNSLSVRELERRVSGHYPPKPPSEPRDVKGKARPGPTLSPELRAIQDRMRAYLQTDVRVELSGPESGTIGIRFYSIDDLDRVLELVLKLGPMQRETP
jgi:hypothetical protein